MQDGNDPRLENEPTCSKIFYASRTHSQLAQVLPEMLRLKLPGRTSIEDISHTTNSSKRPFRDDEDEEALIRHVVLGSRKQLCINERLRKDRRDLDEGCREMLEGTRCGSFKIALMAFAEKKGKRCPHLPPIGEDTPMLDFRDQILVGL
jgi:chromosome transmission fidelity protein 1